MISIPFGFKQSLKRFLDVDPAVIDTVIKKLDETSLTVMGESTLRTVAKELSPVSVKVSDDMGNFLIWLYFLRRRQHKSVAGFLSDLDDAAVGDGINVNTDQYRTFRAFISRVVSAENGFGKSLKSSDLLTQNQRNFAGARVISDVRPMYDEEISTGGRPTAAVITHSLKVDFVENDQRKEWYVGMDTSDLRRLSREVQRALDKLESLYEMIANNGLSCIDAEVVADETT